MRFLLSASRLIDRVNERLSVIANWLVLLSALVSAGNAFSRYAFSLSSNAWLEIQWYMFGAMVMLGASFTLKRNEHVRVDVIYANLSTRAQIWIDIVGGVLFLLPAMIILCYLSWPVFHNAWVEHEMSANAGGLLRWPIKFVIPAGFVMLALQGVSEVIKRIAALQNLVTIDAKYERPMQ